MKAQEHPIKEDEKAKDLGRVNFFLINQTNLFIKDFLKVNILDNCIFLLIIDLDKHKDVKETIQRWINFIEQELEAYLRSVPLEERKEVIEHFKLINDKLRKMEYKGGFFETRRFQLKYAKII